MSEIILASNADRTAGLADQFASTRPSTHTRAAYRLDLIGCSYPLGQCRHRDPNRAHRVTAWLPWCYAQGIDPWTAAPGDVSVWLTDLTTAGESSGTRARRLAAVSSWYRWLGRNGHASHNPADLEPQERPVRRAAGTAGVALSREQVTALMRTADTDSPRAGALVAAFLLTGARVSELIGADVDDLGHDRGHRILTIRGKGAKVRLAPCVPALCERIDAYRGSRADIRPANLPARTPTGTRPRVPLFATSTGQRLDRAYVLRLIGRLAVAAGILGTLTPHDLRRTFGTLALDDGVPLRDVQDALGHADPRTTRGYDRGAMNPDRHPAYRLAALSPTPSA